MTKGLIADTRRGHLTRGFLLSGLLGLLSLLPVSSVVDAAPFQQYRNSACTTSPICEVDFPVVQNGKRSEITHISCYLRLDGNARINAMQVLVMDGTDIRSAVTLQPGRTDGILATNELVYSASHPVFVFANAGQRLRFFTDLKQGAFKQFACHASGELLKTSGSGD